MTDPSARPPETAADPRQTPTDQTHARGDESSVPFATAAESDPRFSAPAFAGEVGTFGRYRVLQKIGEGGMGAVFLGYDSALERKVALKVVLPKYAAIPEARERFLREARSAAKVKSDHVVTIHDFGEEGGIPYMAMEYLLGLPLDKFLRERGDLPLTEALRVCRETAQGLAAAHELGLTHRDIKPGNLWLESPNGRVKLIDFGLARLTNEDVHLTSTGAVMGTLAYMSPEQGRGQKVDQRSDLFSLGVLLYRLCTGRMPFSGNDQMSLLTSLAVDTPTPIRQINPQLPPTLEWIVARLLAKNPADRFQSALEVVEAIRSIEHTVAQPVLMPVPMQPFVVGAQTQNVWESIDDSESVPVPLATPTDTEATPAPAPGAVVKSLPKSARKRPERKIPKWPLFVAAGVLLVAVAVLAAILFRPQYGTLQIMNAEADTELVIKKNGEVVHDRTREREIRLQTGKYTIELADVKPGTTLDRDTFEITKGETSRVTVRPPVPVFTQGKLIVTGAEPDVELVIKRDGQVVQDRTKKREFPLEPGTYTIEVAAAKPNTKIEPDKVEIARGQTRSVKVTVQVPPTPPDEVIHPLPELIAPLTALKPAKVINLDGLDPKNIPAEEKFAWQPRELVAVLGSHRQRFPGSIDTLVIRPDSKVVLAGPFAMEIETQKVLDWPSFVAFSPKGDRGGTGNRVWDLTAPQKPPREYPVQGNIVTFLTEDLVLTQLGNGWQVWRLDRGGATPLGEKIPGDPYRTAVSPDRKHLALVPGDGTCSVFAVTPEGPKKQFALPNPEGKVAVDGNSFQSINFASSGVLVTLDPKQVVRVWDVSGGEKPYLLAALNPGLPNVRVMPNGAIIRFGPHSFQVWSPARFRFWPPEIEPPQPYTEPQRFGPESTIRSVAVTPDGETIVTGHSNGAVRLWGVSNKTVVERLFNRPPLVPLPAVNPDADFSPTGEYAILRHEDGRNHLWKLSDLSSLLLEQMPQSIIRYRPDGSAIAANVAGSLRIYEADKLFGMETKDFAIGFGQLPICFSPDGKWLAASAGNELVIWNVSAAKPGEVGRAPGLNARRGQFTPDGRYLVTAAGPTVKVWAMTPKGPAIRYERKGLAGISDFALSPDGKTVAFVRTGGPTTLYDLKEGVLEQRKQEYLGSATWIDFSPDSKAMLVGGGQAGLKLLDATTGKVLHEWPTPRGVPTAGRFHPDGRHLFVTNADFTTYILQLPDNADRRAAKYALTLGGTVRLDDAPKDIKKLEELPETNWLALTSADLTGCKGLDNAGLENFRGCMNLKRLTMRDTKVSDKAVTALAATIPQCRIEWNGGLIVPK